jgi:hypothetical protein
MSILPDTLLTRLARADVRLSVVDVFQRGGALFAFLGPLLGGLSAWKWTSERGWDAWRLLGGTALALTGSAVNQGANWLAERGRSKLDYDHSKKVTAGLRALRALMDADRGDYSRFHDQIVRCIKETAAGVCPTPDAALMCCLLRPSSDPSPVLKVVAYSDFRGDKVPAADIPLDEPEGAAHALRDRAMRYVADVQVGAHAHCFKGKPYRAILAIPVMHEGACLGVVSLDSTRAGHFDGRIDEIAAHALPFIEMLAFSLRHDGRAEVRHGP